MHRNKPIRFLSVIVTSTAFMFPSQWLLAETPVAPPARQDAVPVVPRRPENVELQPGGVLTGWVVDGHGTTVGATRVSLHNGQTLVAETMTDATGSFRMQPIRGGVYQLSTGETSVPLRVWANQTAPPGSAQAVMLNNTDVVAGQYSPMKYWLADPLVIGGIVVVAAGVPIILANQNNDSGS